LRELDQIVEIARRSRHGVGAPVQHADVDEPRQRIQRAVPAVRGQDASEETVRWWMEPVEAGNPSGGCEFGRPDDIELKDVRVDRSRIEPLHVELVPLIRSIRRWPQLDMNRWVRLLETLELEPNDLAFPADAAERNAERCLSW